MYVVSKFALERLDVAPPVLSKEVNEYRPRRPSSAPSGCFESSRKGHPTGYDDFPPRGFAARAGGRDLPPPGRVGEAGRTPAPRGREGEGGRTEAPRGREGEAGRTEAPLGREGEVGRTEAPRGREGAVGRTEAPRGRAAEGAERTEG